MSKLLKEYTKVTLGGKEVEIKELTILKLRKSKNDIVQLVKNFFNKIEEVQKMDTEDDGTIDMLNELFDFVLDAPFEVCKIFIPDINKEQVENATGREIYTLINTALEVNGFFMMKEKLGKALTSMR